MLVQWVSSYRDVSWVARLGLAAMAISSPSTQAADISLALMPGEVFMVAANCGIIMSDDAFGPLIAKGQTEDATRATVRAKTWTGECVDGLAHGNGSLEDVSAKKEGSVTAIASYWYGRRLKSFELKFNERCGQRSYSTKSGQVARIPFVDSVAVLGADWAKLGACYSGSGFRVQTAYLLYKTSDGVSTSIRTFEGSCASWGYQSGDMPPRCKPGQNEFTVYGLSADVTRDAKTTSAFTPCPNIESHAGCEATWDKLAGDVVRAAKEVMAQHELETESTKAMYTQAVEPYFADLKAERAQREAAAAKAEQARQAEVEADRLQAQQEQLEREAQNAADQAAQEKAAKEKAAAQQKAREKEAQALQAKLNKMNPGELFAYADEQMKIGDRDSAIQVLRLLVSKYPNSPLVAVAAQQLAQLKPLTEQEKAKLRLGPSK